MAAYPRQGLETTGQQWIMTTWYRVSSGAIVDAGRSTFLAELAAKGLRRERPLALTAGTRRVFKSLIGTGPNPSADEDH